MRAESHFSIQISGPRLNFEGLEDLFGKPSRTNRRGERTAAGRIWPEDRFVVDSPLRKRAAPEKHLTWALETLKPKRKMLIRFRKDKITVYCGFNQFSEQGSFALKSEAVKMLAELNAEVYVFVLALLD